MKLLSFIFSFDILLMLSFLEALLHIFDYYAKVRKSLAKLYYVNISAPNKPNIKKFKSI